MGNMGYYGFERRIGEVAKICKKEKCLFILSENGNKGNISYIQSKKFHDYVIGNYEKIGEIYGFDIYSNEEDIG